MIIGMIPARMGSQRLTRKNLREIGGVTLLAHAIRRAKASGAFDEIWVNAEHDAFAEIAAEEGARFHRRPQELANNVATSEQYIHEFLLGHDCEFVVQLHSIAPLLGPNEIAGFVERLTVRKPDVLLSVVEERIECLLGGTPVNFTFEEKTNSQELTPVERVTWSITGWRRRRYLDAIDAGRCATYDGRVETFAISRPAGHIIKTAEDLAIAQALREALQTDSLGQDHTPPLDTESL